MDEKSIQRHRRPIDQKSAKIMTTITSRSNRPARCLLSSQWKSVSENLKRIYEARRYQRDRPLEPAYKSSHRTPWSSTMWFKSVVSPRIPDWPSTQKRITRWLPKSYTSRWLDVTIRRSHSFQTDHPRIKGRLKSPEVTKIQRATLHRMMAQPYQATSALEKSQITSL